MDLRTLWIDDNILKNYRQPYSLRVFVPSSPLVVLGSSNDVHLEVNVSACESLDIPITRRYGGGGTVVLYDGCVVLSFGTWVKDPYQNSLYFKMINQALINSLAKRWPGLSHLGQNGISDIVMGPQKVAGTSLFRSRHYLLYQASVLVQLDRELIASVLKHPTKEPSYRAGRDHKSFLTCLTTLEPTIESSQQVADCLQDDFFATFKQISDGHMIDPVESEMKSLEERLLRSSEKTTL